EGAEESPARVHLAKPAHVDARQRTPEAVPAGQVEAALHPGEAPRDRPYRIATQAAGAPHGGPGAEAQTRELLDRGGRAPVLEKAGGALDQIETDLPGGAGRHFRQRATPG